MEKNKDEDETSKEKKVGRLPENTISYFKRVDQMLEEDNIFEDTEHKETFLRNVYVQIEDSTTQLLRHTLTSKVLEKIIPLLHDELYMKFLSFIEEDLEKLMTDRFASHVIETTCKTIQKHIENKPVVKMFCKTFKKLCTNISMLIRDTYGTHVIATLLQVYSGTNVAEKVTSSRHGSKEKKALKNKSTELIEVISTDLPKYFPKNLDKYINTILDDDNFGELLSHRHASSLLQVLLLVTSKQDRDLCNKAIDKILGRLKIYKLTENLKDEDEDTIHRLPVILVDEIGSHLFEIVLQTADVQTKENLISKCFPQIIATLCLHPIANFTAQLIIRLTSDIETLDVMIGKILSYMEDILACGHMGCVVATAEVIANNKMESRQKEFCKVIKSSLHIPDTCETKPLAKLITCLLTYDIFYEKSEMSKESDGTSNDSKQTTKSLDKSQINYHGVLILKNCFLFRKNKLIIDSFLGMELQEYIEIASHMFGGFVYETFYSSENIAAKKKNKLSEMLLDRVETLSCDKFGSRVIDAIWMNSDQDMKTKLQKKLTENKLKLSNNMYGRIVLSNCNVFKNRRFQEKEALEKRKRKFVEEIIPSKSREKFTEKPKEMKLEESTEITQVKKDEPKESTEITQVKKDEPKESTEITQVKKDEPKKKKKEKDRAEKYRQQLQSLGITL